MGMQKHNSRAHGQLCESLFTQRSRISVSQVFWPESHDAVAMGERRPEERRKLTKGFGVL